ncbi:DNA (cytosine-5)-methyltransferase 1 [Paenibacillus rhizosphaerae]|uniref:Cytosine-specific methyltransferase n=1 Tax=Paenibacillus rhizosphaerae TaxID=297318 RepID=A0A839TWS9_9BACL|nr:DNA cytosine methyltransferase [Paenibacillus rhizosphaerae]MBB3131305.1 DNA (cytosine-5)-methyltransferase 1 [Paenibacillus rhizosphaerae]
MKFSAIDLFSGAGGVSEALKEHFDIKCAVEFDEIIARTYELNHGNSHLLVKDIRKIRNRKWNKIKRKLNGEDLDLLIATPPCQGFSRHSRKKTVTNADDRNKLIMEIIRVAKIFQPNYILFENVDNIVNFKIFHIFLSLLTNLNSDGFKKDLERPSYHLRFEVVDAVNYGVPQHRKRMILVGKKINLFPNIDAIIQESGKGLPFVTNPLSLWPEKVEAPTLREHLKPYNLSRLEAGGTDEKDRLHRCRNLSPENLIRIRNTPLNGGSRSDWTDEGLALECHKKANVSFGDVYGRMNFDDYAPTITCGCLAYTKGRFGHPEEDRAISMREAALIQTFPVHYKFTGKIGGNAYEGSSEHIATQIGNAVPVKLAQSFVDLIYNQLIKEAQTDLFSEQFVATNKV